MLRNDDGNDGNGGDGAAGRTNFSPVRRNSRRQGLVIDTTTSTGDATTRTEDITTSTGAATTSTGDATTTARSGRRHGFTVINMQRLRVLGDFKERLGDPEKTSLAQSYEFLEDRLPIYLAAAGASNFLSDSSKIPTVEDCNRHPEDQLLQGANMLYYRVLDIFRYNIKGCGVDLCKDCSTDRFPEGDVAVIYEEVKRRYIGRNKDETAMALQETLLGMKIQGGEDPVPTLRLMCKLNKWIKECGSQAFSESTIATKMLLILPSPYLHFRQEWDKRIRTDQEGFDMNVFKLELADFYVQYMGPKVKRSTLSLQQQSNRNNSSASGDEPIGPGIFATIRGNGRGRSRYNNRGNNRGRGGNGVANDMNSRDHGNCGRCGSQWHMTADCRNVLSGPAITNSSSARQGNSQGTNGNGRSNGRGNNNNNNSNGQRINNGSRGRGFLFQGGAFASVVALSTLLESRKSGGGGGPELWVSDGAATFSITNSTRQLRNYRQADETVTSGAGPVKVIGFGDLDLVIKLDNGESHVITLHDVGHAPDMPVQLIRQQVLQQQLGGIHGDEDSRILVFGRGETTLTLTEEETSKVHILDAYRLESGMANVTLKNGDKDWEEVDINAFHRIIGHRQKETLHRTAASMKVKLTGTLKEHCEACVEGGMRREAMNKKVSDKSHIKVLTEFHIDVQKAPTRGYGGMNYLVVITDRSNSKSYIYSMRYKGEVRDTWNRFVNEELIDNPQWCGEIYKVRADNGKEIFSEKTINDFRSMGIKIELTSPGTPEQNALAEQALSQNDYTGSKLMVDANLQENHQRLWPWAAFHANRQRNAQTTRRIQQDRSTEEERQALLREPPFGARAFVRNMEDHQHYQGDRALLCIYLGKARNMPEGTAVFYHLRTKRVIVRSKYEVLREVRWDGYIFGTTSHLFNNEENKEHMEELKLVAGGMDDESVESDDEEEVYLGRNAFAPLYVNDEKDDIVEKAKQGGDEVNVNEAGNEPMGVVVGETTNDEAEGVARGSTQSAVGNAKIFKERGVRFAYTNESKGEKEIDWEETEGRGRGQRTKKRSSGRS
jgi:hypothetical protein